MFGKLILLGLIALAQSRPQDEQLASVASRCNEVGQYLIPNERDCSKFYICGVGRSAVREGVCQPGLEFSVELQQCADPTIAKCNCNPEEEVVPAPTAAPEPEEDREIIYLPNGCPEDGRVSQLLPHENLCNLYYQCNHGQLVLRECGPGTSYSHALQACDHSSIVNCINNGTTTQRTTTTTVAVEEESREIVYLPNGCPEDFNVNLMLPHETICSKFYYCVHGEKVERECGRGTVFNPAIMDCDHAWAVDCQDVTTECICDNSEEDCDGSSTTTGKPEYAEKEDSNENNESAEKVESSEKDDSAEKKESNEKDESSDKEESSKKEDSVEKEQSKEKEDSAEKSDTAEKEESGENVGNSCENGDNESEESKECNCGGEESEEVEDLRCKEDCHVPHWAHESDCDKFWRCVGEHRVLGVCSEGLHFNEKTQTCDFICNVDCKRVEVQSTARRDGLNLFLPWDKVNDLFEDSSMSVKKLIKKLK